MTENEIRDVINRWVDAWNATDAGQLKALYEENVVLYFAPIKKTLVGRDYVLERFKGLKEMSRDSRLTVRELHIVGDTAVAEINVTGTHTGNFLGFEPTGRTFDFDSCLVFKLKDGKLVRHTTYVDDSIVLRVLGLIAIPEARPEAA